MILFAEIKVNFKNSSAAVRQADLNIIVRQPTYCTVAFAVLRSVAGSHNMLQIRIRLLRIRNTLLQILITL